MPCPYGNDAGKRNFMFILCNTLIMNVKSLFYRPP